MDKSLKSFNIGACDNIQFVNNSVNNSVDNSKNDVFSSKVVIKKPKILRIDLNESILEGNLIEMPFVSYIDRKKKEILGVVEYKWIDSNGNERGVEVRGSVKYGVPTSFEFDVLITLLRIYVQNKKILLNSQYNELEISEEDITIEFTLRQVAKELGMKSINPTIIDKILKAIEILTDTTIYNRYSGGIYDIEEKKYIENKSIAFHIVEKFETYLYRDGVKRKRGQDIHQKIKLNQFFYKSISGNYFKFFNHTEYTAISSSVGRRLFLILNKWRGDNKSSLKIKCETLYQRIPLDSSIIVSRKNQMLKRAFDSLVNVGFVKDFEIKDCTVTITFNIKNIDNNIDKQMYFKDKYNNHNDIIEKLESINFSKDEIQNYLNIIVFDNDYVKALLRYADIQIKYCKIDNIKGFIISGLVKKYNIDQKYYNE